MNQEPKTEYDTDFITFHESVWGEGYLSPGGSEEVDLVLQGIDLVDKDLLDIGCGTGGVDVHIATRYRPRTIVAVDVEPGVLNKARELIEQNGLTDRVDFRQVDPGPLPFDDGSFDAIFSKDAIVHVSDKQGLAGDVMRLLRPGGVFVASDWLSGYEGEPSEMMRDYLRGEGLDFELANAAAYRSALEQAGFCDIRITDRNAWYRQVARDECVRLSSELSDLLAEKLGFEYVDEGIAAWKKMVDVLESGELRPTHFYAVRPLQ